MFPDLRYALRLLLKSPGFTTVAVLALALGIGANTAIFSVVNAVLLRPLPYKDPERLVMVWEEASFVGFPRNTPAVANYADWKKQNQVFEDMAAIRGRSYNLTGQGDPERLLGWGVTFNFFSVLGVKPLLGRVFVEEDDKPGAANVALISHGLWKRSFGGDPKLIGNPIHLDGQKFTVLGVMPPRFQFPAKETDIWTPAAFTNREWAERGSHYLRVVARLKPNTTLERAQSDMEVIARRLARDYPDNNANIGAVVVPLRDQLVGQVRPALILLLAAVGAVLLIACANLANLLLARATARQKEIAVRMALGAGRLRIIRQLLTEAVLLAGLGGLAGVLLSTWSFAFLAKLVPESLVGTTTVGIDWGVLGFAIAVSLMTGLIFGIAPALRIARSNFNELLRVSRAPRPRVAASSFLVVSEVAVAFVLLIAAGLLIKTLARLRGLDPGFHAENVLTMRTVLPGAKYAAFPNKLAFFQQVLDRVKTLPGVVSAGYTTALPLTMKGGTNGFSIEGHPRRPDGPVQDANIRVITPDYLRTLGIPLLRGRNLEERDGPQSQPVAIINEAMARKFWPNEDALGKRFKIGPDSRPWVTIVGIAGDVRQMGLEIPGRQEMYFPVSQSAQLWAVPQELAIRTSVDPMSLAAAVRREIHAVDPEQPVSSVRLMEEILENETSQRRLQVWLLGGFAGLALLLASLGIYGVLSYAVTQRTPEIGVRMALGAQQQDVLRMVMGRGMGLAALGAAVGLGVALALSRVLSSLLFGVAPTNLATFSLVTLLLLSVALLACWIPARRATKVDPMVALRWE